jgi:hypothetical protein
MNRYAAAGQIAKFATVVNKVLAEASPEHMRERVAIGQM